MGLRIVVSSAVTLPEKTQVIEQLKKMQQQNKISIDWIYDCAEKATLFSGGDMGSAKQIEINTDVIMQAHWFICLATDATVGEKTAEELKLAAAALRDGAHLVITVMHDGDRQAPHPIPQGKVLVAEMMREASAILGIAEEQYFCHYHANDDFSALQQALELEFDKLQAEHRFYNHHIDCYTLFGREVTAEQLYFDANRAQPEYGFRPDFYIPRRSVDDKLLDIVEKKQHSFLFLNGRPGSGKTRAVYELLHRELADERVVIMRRENASDIANALLVSMNNTSKVIQIDRNFHDTDYYFVCDQVCDVLQSMPEELQKLFLQAIDACDNCLLIGTSTPSALDSLKRESKIIDSSRDSGNSCTVEIHQISEESDYDREQILTRLRAQYPEEQGETIGDFIKELNRYKQEIAERIIEKIDRREADSKPIPYLGDLLHALQLVRTFRYSTPLFLAVMTMRKMQEQDPERLFIAECMKAVNYLVEKNAVWLTGLRNRTLLTEDDFDLDDEQIYDHETFRNIIPVTYTFTINEIVWEVLQQTQDRHLYDDRRTRLFYDMSDPRGLRRAMRHYYETFPAVISLRRMLPRIPQQNDALLAEAVRFVHTKIRQIKPKADELADMQLLYGILLARSQSIEAVEELLQEIGDRGIAITDTMIAEIYSFALRQLADDPELFSRFTERVRERDRARQAPFQPDCCYKAGFEIRVFYNDYAEAYRHIRHLFEQAGTDVLRKLAADESSLEWFNIGRMLAQLLCLAETMEEVGQVAELYRELELRPVKPACYAMAGIARNSRADQQRLLDLFFADDAAVERQQPLFVVFIVSLISQARCFEDARWLYELYCDKCRPQRTNIKLISLAINRTREWEFQEAVAFLNKTFRNQPNHIFINKLMSLAPNNDDALYFLGKLEYVQNYTLSNILKKFEKANRWSSSQDLRFIPAYELIHHPRLQHLRNDLHILNYLYKYASDKWQEACIDRMLSADRYRQMLENKALPSIKITRPYRSFVEAYEGIFREALLAQERLCDNGKMQPDLYNTMIGKYEQECRKRLFPETARARQQAYERLWSDMQSAIERNQLFVDEELIFNCYIKTGKLPLFRADDAALTAEFLAYVNRRKGDADFYHTKIWSKLIYFVAGNRAVASDVRERRCLTLYRFYRSLYLRARHPRLAPTADLYANLLTAAGSADYAAAVEAEIKRFHIEPTEFLQSKMQGVEQTVGYRFTCRRQPQVNIHSIRVRNMQAATDYEQIMEQLQAEYADYGILLPSMLYAGLNAIYKRVRRDPAKKAAAYGAITQFIRTNGLDDAVSARAQICLAQLAPDEQLLREELDRYDRCEDPSATLAWKLAIDPFVRICDKRRCRGYFRRWLELYRAIYPTEEALREGLGEEGLNNLKKHFRIDAEFVRLLRRQDPDAAARLDADTPTFEAIYPLLQLYETFTASQERFF